MTLDTQTGTSSTRRSFILGTASLFGLAVSGCTTVSSGGDADDISNFVSMYGPRPKEKFPIPGIDISKVPSRFRRKRVRYKTSEKVGTIVVEVPVCVSKVI